MGGEAGSDERDEREGRIEGRREKASKGYNKVGFGQSSHSHSLIILSAVQCSAVQCSFVGEEKETTKGYYYYYYLVCGLCWKVLMGLIC